MTNEGSAPAIARAPGWYDSIYLSTDDQIGVSDWRYTPDLLQQVHNNLPAGSSYTNTLTLTVPSRTPGDYYMIFATDRQSATIGGVLGEESETNNTRALPVRIEAPNLRIVSVTAPTNALANDAFDVSWTVTNAGTASAAASWSDLVYFSETNTHTPGILVGGTSADAFRPLEPGATYTLTNRITLPSSGSGNYFLLFRVDAGNAQGESDETDNWHVHPITIASPDLELKSAAAPASVGPGESATFLWVVENVGQAAAAGSWVDAIFLSTNNVFDGSAVFVRQADASPFAPLAAGMLYTNHFMATLPDFPAGPAYLLFIANYGNHQGETSYANNTLARPITITAPDLNLLNASSPSEAAVNQPIDVSWTVGNTGDSAAGFAWQDAVYISPNSTLDPAALALLSLRQNDKYPLQKEVSYTIQTQLTLSATVTGEVYLIFATDSGNRLREASKANNQTARPITVRAPDLLLQSATVPASFVLSDPVPVTFEVENIGEVPVYGTWTDRALLGEYPKPTGTLFTVGAVTSGGGEPIPTGGTYTATMSVTITSTLNLTPGETRYLFIHVNQDTRQGETTFTNNLLAFPIQLEVPDLLLADATAPAAATLGEYIEVRWTVSNSSPYAASANWFDAVYLSVTNDLSGHHQIIQSAPAIRKLPGGLAYTRTLSFILPAFTPGERFLIFRTDRDGHQAEATKTNNLLALPFSVTAPNLTVSHLTLEPETLQSGEPFTLRWRVNNTGNGPVYASFSDIVHIRNTTTDDLLDFLYAYHSAETQGQPLIEAGSHVEVVVSNRLVDGTRAVGELLFTVSADYLSSVSEYAGETPAEGDNLASLTRPCTLALYADLLACGIQHDASVQAGSMTMVSWSVSNAGERATGEDRQGRTGWRDRVYLSPTTNFEHAVRQADFEFYGSLEPGDSITRRQPILIHPSSEGDYFVFVETDAFKAHWETNKENNIALSEIPMRVVQPDKPDLRVTDVTIPAAPLSGQPLEISWTVNNHGEGTTGTHGWHDAIYLSHVPDIVETSVLIANRENISFLDVGDSYTASFTYAPPLHLQGLYYIVIKANSLGHLDEGGRTGDNLGSAFMNIAMSDTSDLVVTSVIPQAVAFAGEQTLVTYTVKNIGAAPTEVSSWKDAVYLSRDADSTDPGTYLGPGHPPHGVLEPGAEYTVSVLVRVPEMISGPHYIKVKADSMLGGPSFAKVYEHNGEDNNVGTAEQPTQIILLAPDLEVRQVTMPEKARNGESIKARYLRGNYGTKMIDMASWVDAVWLSTNEVWEPTDHLLARNRGFWSMDTGTEAWHETELTIPSDVPPGDYYMIVQTDADNRIRELDVMNNTGVSEYKIQISGETADLNALAIYAPDTALAGELVAIEYTVENIGDGTPLNPWTDALYISSHPEWNEWTTYGATRLAEFSPVENIEELAQGETYTISYDYRMPANREGQFYLHLLVDNKNQVIESDVANNIISTPITLAIPEKAHAKLQVTDITIEGTPKAADHAWVSWTVENTGSGSTDGAFLWRDSIYVRHERFSNERGSLLTWEDKIMPLGPGATYTVRKLVKIPYYLSGTFYLVGRNNYGSKPDYVTETPITIAPATLPNLTATGLTVPETTYAGQRMDLEMHFDFDQGWFNSHVSGQPDSLANDSKWEDAVYLSGDTYFDPASAYLLGYAERSIDDFEDTGPDFLLTGDVGIPSWLPPGPWYVVLRLNARRSLTESDYSDNTIISTQPVQVLERLFVDLVAGVVTIPSNAAPGDRITIEYTVRNEGENPARGTWQDALYLSPSPEWTLDALLLGHETVAYEGTNRLTVGSDYTREVEAGLPGVVPGDYYVIIRSNVRNALPEHNLTNNFSASLNTISLQPLELQLGVERPFKLSRDGSTFFTVHLPPGQTLEVLLQKTGGLNTELYTRFEQPPSRGQYDQIGVTPYAEHQRIVIPFTQSGYYHIMIHESGKTTLSNYTILARLLEFSLDEVIPSSVGNAGPSTLEIIGACFETGTVWEAVSPSNTVLPQVRAILEDSARAFVTFNFTGAETGAYTLRARQPDGQTIEWNDALDVTVGTGGEVKLWMLVNADGNGASLTRPGPFTLGISYGNIGDADIPAPLLKLHGVDELRVGVAYGRTDGVGTLEFIGLSQSGPPEVLRPGQRETMTLFCQTLDVGQYYFNIDPIISGGSAYDLVDWEAWDSGNLAGSHEAEQDYALRMVLAADLGATWNEILASLVRSALERPYINGVPNLLLDNLFREALANAVGRGGGNLDREPPHVMTHIPQGRATGIDALGIVFSESMNPATCLPEHVVLRGPDGQPVAGVSVRPVTGRFAWIEFPAQNTPGYYRIEIGPGITDNADWPLDQNFDGQPGVPGDDVYIGGFAIGADGQPAPGIFVTDVKPAATIAAHNGLSQAFITFSSPPDSLTFTPGDVLLTTPSETVGALAIERISPTIYRAILPPQTTPGDYALTIGPHIENHHGLPMDQNGDGTPGPAFESSLRIEDQLGPRVTAYSPEWFVTNPVTTLTVTFSEPIDAATLTAGCVRVVGPSGEITPKSLEHSNPDQLTIHLNPFNTPGDITVTILPGMADLHGNLMDQNQNGTPGEESDAFEWSFLIPQTVALMPLPADSRFNLQNAPTPNPDSPFSTFDLSEINQPYEILTIFGKVKYGGIPSTLFTDEASLTVQLWERDGNREVNYSELVGEDPNDDLVAETRTLPDGSYMFDKDIEGRPILSIDTAWYNRGTDDPDEADGTRPLARYYVLVLAKNARATSVDYAKTAMIVATPEHDQPWMQTIAEGRSATLHTQPQYVAPIHSTKVRSAPMLHMNTPPPEGAGAQPAWVFVPDYEVTDNAFILAELGNWAAKQFDSIFHRPRIITMFSTDALKVPPDTVLYDKESDCIVIGIAMMPLAGPSLFHEYGHAIHEFFTDYTGFPYADGQQYSMLQYSTHQSTVFAEAWASFIGAWLIKTWEQERPMNPVHLDYIDLARHYKHLEENNFWMGYHAYNGLTNASDAADVNIGPGMGPVLASFIGYAKITNALPGRTMGGLMSIFWDLTDAPPDDDDAINDEYALARVMIAMKNSARTGTMQAFYDAYMALSGMANIKPAIDSIFIDHGMDVADDPQTDQGEAHRITNYKDTHLAGLIISRPGPGNPDEFFFTTVPIEADGRPEEEYIYSIPVTVRFQKRYGNLDMRIAWSNNTTGVFVQEDRIGNNEGLIEMLVSDLDLREEYFVTIEVYGHGGLIVENDIDINYCGDFHPDYELIVGGGNPMIPELRGGGAGDGGGGGGAGGGGGGGAGGPLEVRNASDPNDILGPPGYGPENWVSADPLHYMIRFENESTAGAWAREVRITQQLDPDLDWRSFRVGAFGWSDVYIQVPPNRPFYNTRLDLRDEMGIYADVAIGVDIQTGEAFWRFMAIDPQTGLPPEAIDAGLLPPEDGEGAGQGFAKYAIAPTHAIESGTIIDALATIIFDTELPIDTPPIFHTIDPAPPLATITSLYPKVESNQIYLRWTAQDAPAGSGLAGVDIFVSQNDSPETLWLENTPETDAIYYGSPGETYRFRLVASDNVGQTTGTPATETTVSGTPLGPYLTARRSAAEHIGLGQLTLDITPDGQFTEPRLGGLQTLLLTFSKSLAPATFTPAAIALSGLTPSNTPIDLSAVAIATSLSAGNTQAEITFTPPLSQTARYTITLDGLTDTEARTMEFGNTLVLSALPGDLTADRAVDTNDLAQLQALRADTPLNPADPRQIRADINRDGHINNLDLTGLYTLLDGTPHAPAPAATNGTLTLAIRSAQGADQLERLQGETFALDVTVSADQAAEHTASIFHLETTPAGLLYDSLLWHPAYSTNTPDDDSSPTPQQLPTTLTNRVRLSNVANAAAPWQTFTTGTLATLQFTIPTNFPAGPLAIRVTPETLANVWTILPATNATDFTLTIQADTNQNAIPDDWENTHFGQTVNPSDLAANTYNTLLEAYIAGLDPTDPQDVFLVANMRHSDDGHDVIEWQPRPGRLYDIYRSTNLIHGFQLIASDLQSGTFTNHLHPPGEIAIYCIRVKR